MKNTHQNYIYMCQRLKKFYRRHDQIFDSHNHLSALFVNLSALIDQFQIEFEKSVTHYNGFSIERARKRDELQVHAVKVSTAITHLRQTLKYKPIEQLNGFVNKDMVELSLLNEEELLDYASGLYDLYLVCEPRLKIQGLKQKEVDQFVNALTLFAIDYPMNKFAIEMRKQASLMCLKAHAELNEFIENKLDVEMETFGKTYPELLAEYHQIRIVQNFDFNSKPDLEGEINDGEVHVLKKIRYDRDREFRVSVDGGSAIWGLSSKTTKIEHARPVNPREKINVLSRWIGIDGDYLLIQNVNPNQNIQYKIWITES